MGDIFADYDVLGAVWVTIQLSLLGIIGAMVLGTIIAVLRVSPVAVLRGLGVNTVPVGQAEAARSIGLGFGQSLREVILPQAFRGSIAPLGSVVIALIKNSTVAAVIGVGDSAGLLQVITENEGASLPTFFFFAMVFVVLTLPIGLWTTSLSRKLSVKR